MGGTGLLAQEGLREEPEEVPKGHVSQETSDDLVGLNGIMRQLVENEPAKPLRPELMDYLTWKARWVDRSTFEVLVPVRRVVHQPALHILLPERRAAIDAQAVEAEAVDAEL